MKKRIIAPLAIIALFGLGIAAAAYNTTSTVTKTAKTCCSKKDGESCPMKGKGHDGKGEHAKMSCCKKHGDDQAKSGDHSKADGHSCCDCCDSCPMKKDGTTATATSDGKSCCDNCECCKGKTEPKV